MGSFWGPHYPDAGGGTFTVPAVPASVPLGPPLLNGGAGDHLRAEHEVAGTFGNGWRIRFVEGTLSSVGDVSVSGSDVTVFYNDGDQVGTIIATVNAVSPIKILGTHNPSDQLFSGDDEFDYVDLEHGVDPLTGIRSLFWGPHYPDAAFVAESANFVPGSGPPGVATFALMLEESFVVKYRWCTDIFKADDGRENRAAVWDDPRQEYSGLARLVGENALEVRDQLYRYAALGSTFLLGLPHEELTILGPSSGRTVPVTDTSGSDWANVGQRVVVVAVDGRSVSGVVQDLTSSTVALDSAPSDLAAVCAPGSKIMPVAPVVLDAAQGFNRYPIARDRANMDLEQVESWNIAAFLVNAGFVVDPRPAYYALGGELEGFIIQLKNVDYTGTITISSDTTDDITVDTSIFGDNVDVFINFDADTTTIADFVAEFSDPFVSANLTLIAPSSYNPSDVLTDAIQVTADDFVAPVPFSPPELGRGATVNTFDDRPIFDRGSDADGSVGDSLQSQTKVIDDVGASPYAVGRATKSDWGRHVAISRSDFSEWQWFKKFLETVRGCQRAFWLPTFREDLRAVEDGPGGGTTGQIVVETDWGVKLLAPSFGGSSGSTFTRIMVAQGDETYYATITGRTDNHDGTTTLDIETEVTIPAAAPITMISWLELCRFEDDEFAVEWRGATFSCATRARVVQR